MEVVAKLELPVTVRVVKRADSAVRTDEKRLEVVAKLAVRLDVEAFVDTKLVVVAFVIDALMALRLVEVALLMTPLIAKRLVLVLLVEDELVVKKLVLVALVEARLVVKKLVEVALANVVLPETEREVILVVAKVEVPDTNSVPVAMMFPAVRELIVAVTAERIVAKKEEEVALVAVN